MNLNELSLILFTVLTQAAFGLVASMAVLLSAGQPAVRIVCFKKRQVITGIALLLMAGALFFSLFHLGSPVRAIYALSNLRNSWLSREILMVLIFSTILLIWFAGVNRGMLSEGANRIMMVLAVVSGAMLVYSMARLYMLPAVPAWDSHRTIVLFYSSGILTGTMLLLAIIMPSFTGGHDKPAGYRFAPFLLAGTVAMLLRIGFSLFPTPVENVAFAPENVPMLLSVLNILLPLSGMATGVLAVIFPHLCGKTGCSRLMVLSLILIFAGEITGRYIFYAGYFSAGI